MSSEILNLHSATAAVCTCTGVCVCVSVMQFTSMQCHTTCVLRTSQSKSDMSDGMLYVLSFYCHTYTSLATHIPSFSHVHCICHSLQPVTYILTADAVGIMFVK